MSTPAQPSRTPDYWHVMQNPVWRSAVYEPEADTFLVMSALDADAARLRALSPVVSCEIGCGSGVLLTHLFAHVLPTPPDAAEPATALVAPTSVCIAIDINPAALAATAVTWQRTLAAVAPGTPVAPLDVIRGDLATMLRLAGAGGAVVAAADAAPGPSVGGLGVDGPLDVLIFNPPYVPTSAEELRDALRQLRAAPSSDAAERAVGKEADLLPLAWCGGDRGREVLDRLLPDLSRLLRRGGLAYIVALEENEPDEIVAVAAEAAARRGHRLVGEVALRRYTGERLCVIRVERVL